MDLLSRNDLKTLMLEEDGTLISMYMPTTRVGDEKAQGPTRMRNLIKKARDMLPVSGLRAPELESFLKPAEDLLDDALFWQYQDEGLALLISAKGMRTYRLPLPFDEQVFMSGHFQVKPLLPLFTADGHFFLLSLNLGEVKLMYGNRYGLRVMDMKSAPGNLVQSLNIEDPGTHKGPMGFVGSRPSGYHGHGVGTDYKKTEILQFFHELAHGVHEVIRSENAPLILAGDDYLLPIYREANQYPYLAKAGIAKDPESLGPEELHSLAWNMVEPVFAKAMEEARMRYKWFSGVRSSLATNDLKDIVVAAYTGRIDTLFVALHVQRWGFFEPDSLRVDLLDIPATGARDLLDAAAVLAIQNRGRVYAVGPEYIPGGSTVAALCRYEL